MLFRYSSVGRANVPGVKAIKLTVFLAVGFYLSAVA